MATSKATLPKDMDQLAAEQDCYAQELQRVITNYTKDSRDRKTSAAYYEERLRRLDAAWSLFERTDEEIRNLPAPPLNHPYFSTELYDKTAQTYEQQRGYFLDRITQLKEANIIQTTMTSKSNQLDTTTGATTTHQLTPTKPTTIKTPTPTQAIPAQSLVTNQLPAISTHQEADVIRIMRRQRAVIQALYRIFSSLEDNKAVQHPRSFYELNINTIQRYWSQVEEHNNSIWELVDDPTTLGYDVAEYIKIEETVQQKLIQLSTKLEGEFPILSPPVPASTANPLLKLPKITLPRFDGDYTKWRQFFDLFSQMVHNQAMSNCQKMWYLKTNLSGEAEKLIRHFTLSDDNYVAAWNLLQERYENTRLLVAALINKLLNQPSHATEAPSATSIKAMHDITKECLLGLENLGVSTTNWDPLLLHILFKKLDRNTHALYEQSLTNPKSLQSLKEFLKFLETRFQSLEALGTKGKGFENAERKYGPPKPSSLTSVISSSSRCAICNGSHPIFRCQKFLKMTPSDRLNILKKHSLCINCLKRGHNAPTCTLRSCTKCNQRHNTLVHTEPPSTPREANTSNVIVTSTPPDHKCSSTANDNSRAQPLTLATCTDPNQGTYVLLGTARIKLLSDNGRELECRAIIDSGSQINLISERTAKRLGATQSHAPMRIQGIGQGSQKTQKRVNVELKSRTTAYSTRLEAFVINNITSPQPSQPLTPATWAIPKNIQLADPTFYKPEEIDVLLGAEFAMQLLSIGQIKLGQGLPLLQNTVFGWIVTGKINKVTEANATCGICTEDMDLEQMLERFWQIEEAEEVKENTYTLSERRCETIFNQTVTTAPDGRFIVSLPFAEDPKTMGESKNIALRRFYSLERKLSQNQQLQEQYVAFMDEYLKLGHMEEVDERQIPFPHYFLPHHSVLKPDSSTTKLRVVFDASAKTSTNISLNDVLHTGPTIQDDLFSILLRFRLPRFVFTADIEKMYRQVLLKDEDRRYHLIWWRSHPDHPLKCYQLRTVTYGTSAAPYLATKCLQRLAQNEAGKYPAAAEILQRDFYVDDVMTGTNSLATARDIQAQLIELLNKAGFKLRKWCANHPQLLQGISPADQEIKLDFTDEKSSSIKTLGLTWLPKADQFQVKITPTAETKVTKRIVISEIARLFDPLGIMTPVIVTSKIFLQQLWKLKLHWDASLPAELHTKWVNFRKSLLTLNSIQFPRHIFAQDTPRDIQFHAFADASEEAFGSAIYIRSINSEGRIIVRLLCAKSKVAPTKRSTLPRLELCAAKMAAELLHRVRKALKLEQTAAYLWTDSEIVLAWINSTSSSFQTFVGNRIAAIQRVSLPSQWRHVKSKENPADLISRGVFPEKLSSCNLWFYGPPFLHGKEDIWPPPYTKRSECDVEKKRAALTATTLNIEDNALHLVDKIDHRNSFRRLQRVIGYVLRFITRTRKEDKQVTTSSTLTAQELDEALFVIIKRIQESEFQDDIRHLSQFKEASKTSSLATLAPILDEKGILRVGGRLEASSLPYDTKHPMLLPHNHEITKLIMSTYHQENYHIGPQGLLTTIRQRFWPLKGKSIARSVVQHCVRCARSKPKTLSQMMGNLPAHRVQPARPFINSGVDFCGPIWIHFKIRGKRPQKAYIAIFCCFSTKAVHLEVVSDLTTEAFIGALKRFTGRRGHCRNLYCDNATNFVGARNQLMELRDSVYSNKGQEIITSTCSQKGIDFHFIPPRSPHFGGLWEAAVKSAKHLLVRTVSSASLTYEELETALIDIEAILNSRPLIPLSSDPNDLSALTPGHFLIGEPLTTTVDSQAVPMKASLLTRWKLVSHTKNEFWKRWSTEYLHELQYRFKWKHQSPNVKPGMLVVIREENTPIMKWPLGRIEQIYKGEDGCVRVVDVRTTTGILRRPIHKLAPLPVEDDSHDEIQLSQNERNQSIDEEDKLHELKRPLDNQSIVNQNNETSSETPKKRIRRTIGSSLLTVLLTCLILPLTEGDLIEITQFKPELGIHFEDLGTTNLISTNWNLIVYYDLYPYWNELNVLKNGTKALEQLCHQYNPKTACQQIVTHFQHSIEELNSGNELLSPHQNSSRQRRGALNIVGTAANALFGVLDQEYAEKMSKTIDSIKDNENHIMGLLKNQTSIIDSTINVIRKDQTAVERKFNSLDNQITQIINRLRDLGDQDQASRIQQQFRSLTIQMSFVITNVERIQSAILDVITDTNHGRINPLLLSPKQLQQEVARIRTHLPSTLRLPIDQDDILELYKLMNIKGRVIEDRVIFEIKTPLVNWENFDLLRVLPIPVWINNTFIAVEPYSPYLVVTRHRDRYYPITEKELQTCITSTGRNHLCKQLHPIYQRGAKIGACELEFLNNAPKIEYCKLTEVKEQPIWLQLTYPNQWLYALHNQTSINAVCGNELRSFILNGTGILKFQPNCIIKESLITIHGHQSLKTYIKTSYSMLGLSVENLPREKIAVVNKYDNAYESQMETLRDLHERISSLDWDNLPNKLQGNAVHHFSISYIALTATVIISLYVMWKFRKSTYPNRPAKPQPRPRQRINRIITA